MGFYDLSRTVRKKLVDTITTDIDQDLRENKFIKIPHYFSDEDTYIRKATYQAIGSIFKAQESLRPQIIKTLKVLLKSENSKVRQTTINATGEIGKIDFEIVTDFFDKALFDPHHSVRNAVIGSIKKMGEKNPKPVLKWAKQYLHHPDKEIRREICHGIELRGRTHPQEILPMLGELQFDDTARVRNTLVHVLGQIAYKRGCLETVVKALLQWENKELVKKALDEIVDVHKRYENFAILTQAQAIHFIDTHFYR